jgi:hypothetical protein
MAPTLGEAKHEMLRQLILDASLLDGDIAKFVKCSERTVRLARSNVSYFVHKSAFQRWLAFRIITTDSNSTLRASP